MVGGVPFCLGTGVAVGRALGRTPGAGRPGSSSPPWRVEGQGQRGCAAGSTLPAGTRATYTLARGEILWPKEVDSVVPGGRSLVGEFGLGCRGDGAK